MFLREPDFKLLSKEVHYNVLCVLCVPTKDKKQNYEFINVFDIYARCGGKNNRGLNMQEISSTPRIKFNCIFFIRKLKKIIIDKCLIVGFVFSFL